jgi:uncharacterized protein YndB with AHSA1/START domain
MKKLAFTISIKAPKEKVWYSLWDEENYENWTTAFCDGSYAISSWEEGSKIHFLSPSGGGMYSKISENKPFESMVFAHIGNIDNLKELPLDDETKQWTGCEERYTLTEENEITTLTVSVDALEQYSAFFEGSFPKALENIKAIAENPTVKSITVRTAIEATVEQVWHFFTQPEHITKWNFASDDWHCPAAKNNLQVGGTFNYTMASKDEPVAFDFEGTYEAIETHKKIVYKIADGRKVLVKFDVLDDKVILTEIFEPENVHSIALQRDGWQAILDNFKKHIN